MSSLNVSGAYEPTPGYTRLCAMSTLASRLPLAPILSRKGREPQACLLGMADRGGDPYGFARSAGQRPGEIPGAGWDYSLHLASLQELIAYWHTHFDSGAPEKAVEAGAHWRASLDGSGIP